MAKERRQKLKVFKTPAGFHDAYVAAPSRKAALAAWGATTDLFGAGISEEVKDQAGEGAKAALAEPGKVVRVARTACAGPQTAKPSPQPSPARGRGKGSESKAKPRPSRAALERAEVALADLEVRQAGERAEIEQQAEQLAKKRHALEQRQAKASKKAEAKRDAAEKAYRKALADWIG